MSHIAVAKGIADLEALTEAAAQLGLKAKAGSEWKWYGRSVGDYPIPAGFKAEELGKCGVMVLYDPTNTNAYEIGVVQARNPDGSAIAGEYALMYDYWSGGKGMNLRVGEPARTAKGEEVIAPLLLQAYHVAADRRAAAESGHVITTSARAQKNGTIELCYFTDAADASKYVEASYGKDGVATYSPQGYKGPECLAATKPYERANAGRDGDRVETDDMYLKTDGGEIRLTA